VAWCKVASAHLPARRGPCAAPQAACTVPLPARRNADADPRRQRGNAFDPDAPGRAAATARQPLRRPSRSLVVTRLSIVVPTLDEAATLPATLAPLQPLRDAGHEIVVADGGSRDATPAIAAPLADRVLAAPRGRAAQMNAGADLARGDVLVFLHADTRIDPALLWRLAATLPASNARWGRFDVAIEGRSRLLPVVAAMMNLRSRLTGIATGDQAMFVERTLFDAVGGFPPLALMEDIALSRRLKAAAGRPLCLRERIVTSGRRWDRHGAWRTIAAMWRLRFDFWRGVPASELAARYMVHDGEGLSGARRFPNEREEPPTLQIFAREPVPGEVKTRLARSIGDEAAAQVYAELAARCLAAAALARNQGTFGRVELWCTRLADAACCAAWAHHYGFELHEQSSGDLGARMQMASASALARGERIVLVGTDCPELDAAALAGIATALDGADAALIPAQDGGYVAIGLARPLDVFAAVPWSTPEVAAVTRARLAAAGARWRELPALRDIDDEADLAWWRARNAPAQAPHATDGGTLAIGAALIALACLPPLTGLAAAVQPIVVGAFSMLAPGPALPAEWSALTFRGIERHTRYTLTADPEQRTVVHAEADGRRRG
jgi:rSAM/selenodomain-associated transferase 2/rSAM/selenodomain-associated transferase 1